MSEKISLMLKKKLAELGPAGTVSAEVRYNSFKEELQFYVLNFIYHHPEYSQWIMYGGSALRIIHGLDRMSVDLDFEVDHEVTEKFLDDLKAGIAKHFLDAYGAESDFLSIRITHGRGLKLKFSIDDELSVGHPSKQVHVKIDLNNFSAPRAVTERQPISHGQLSFVILTYNMSALMASKLAAIFLRGTRSVGETTYEEKGRDIYDLLWYMGKKIMPDLDYLSAKGIRVNNVRALFDKLTLRMNKVSEENLKQDLSPLFLDQTFIENWLKNWFESYLRLLDDYRIRTVTGLKSVAVFEDFHTDNFSFIYRYDTEEGAAVAIAYAISDYWLDLPGGDLPVEEDEALESVTEFGANGISSHPVSREKLKRYVALFFRKTEQYLQKTNRTILGDRIVTKLIRMTADNLDRKEQIVLTKSVLLSCELEDLLK